MGGGSGKSSSKKSSAPAEVTVADNPNYIPMQQPQAFAPGMKEALASQLAAGYGQGGLLGTNDYTGLLNSIYSPQAIAADPIGVAQQVAAATTPAKIKPAASNNKQAQYANIGGSGRSR